MNRFPFTLIVVVATSGAALANPIPIPVPASMPLEDMYVQIQPSPHGFRSIFTGDFTFDYIPQDVTEMLFPVPPDAVNIGVQQDASPLPWGWSGELYPTILPELPAIPMIRWIGPFPPAGCVFSVDYEHELIERPGEFIFFYALGTGKYFPTYDKTTTATFDIVLPASLAVAGVWLDETPHPYEVVGSHLMLTVQSHFGPITHDLIVSLVRKPAEIMGWRSVREHDGIGPLSIVLDPSAASNHVTSEPRLGGVRRIEVDFDGPVTLVDTTIPASAVDSLMPPVGGTATLENGGHTVVIAFGAGDLADGGCWRIDMAGEIVETVSGDSDCIIVALEGDCDDNKNVSIADAQLAFDENGEPVSEVNCRFDIDLNGYMTIADAQLAFDRNGHTASCP